MGRGYWLPPLCENLTAYDGFYIDSDAVYGNDPATDWERFLRQLCATLPYYERTLVKCCEWKPCGAGQSRFVLLSNRHIDIIAEEVDDYIAVYAIIPEDCDMPGMAKRSFPKYVDVLQRTLVTLYPGKIRKRVNYRKTEPVG